MSELTKTLSELPAKALLAPTDCLVGFTSATVGGERRWPAAKVQEFIEAFIKTQPYIASAWVAFKGTEVAVNANATIYSSYNVASVTRLANFSTTINASVLNGGNGYRYQINFASNTMQNNNYVVLGGAQVGFAEPSGDDQIIGCTGKEGMTANSCIVAAMDMQDRGTNTEGSGYIGLVFLGGRS